MASSPTNQRYPTNAGSGSSLLARTAAVAAAASQSPSPLSSSSTSTAPTTGSATATTTSHDIPSFSRHQHTGAYLDALFPPSRRLLASNLPSPLVSPLGTSFSSNYKPQKPSSLASSASSTGSDTAHDSPPPSSDSDSEGSDEGKQPPSSTEPTPKSISSPASEPSTVDPVQGVFAILDDITLDEEDKIDNVRTRLGQMLEDHEGTKPSPFRLDSIVLDVMHRHREDLNPTGAVFPSSPIRRPGSVRSVSSNANHRPWTPSSKTPLPASGSDTFTGSAHLGGVQLSTGASPGPGASTSGPSASAISTPSHSVGVIGSGSPRASPRPWNDSPAAGGSSLLSSSNSSGNPWSSMLTGPPTPSSSLSYSFNPFGSSSSGTTATATSASTNTTTPGSPFSSVPSGLSAANAAGLAGSSRPASPSPLHSPRMNVAAAAFKPRTASTSSHTSSASAIRPSLLSTPSSSRRSSSQAIMSKNHPTGLDDEDEDDEFSPFATANSAKRSAAIESASGSAGSSGFAFPEDDSSAAMSPFAVLSSVLAPGRPDATASAASQEDSGKSSDWTPEQIEEALASHGYDVDATLASIFESGGKPGQWQRRSPETTAAAPVRIQAPSSTSRSTGAAGVSLMPRETFASFRGAKGGSAATSGHALSSSPSYLNAGTSTPPLRGSSSQGLQSPVPGSQALGGGGGGAGPGRVCRYFLSGDCRRADCRFSHDLSKALCKFWLRGMCLNDPCPFLHDEELVRGLVGGVAAASLHSGGSTPPVYTPGGRHSQDLNRDPFDAAAPAAMGSPSLNPSSSGAPGDFPELPPSGPRAQREKQQQQRLAADKFPPPGTPTGPAASDPTRNRWANALQKKATNPMSVIQSASSQAGNGVSDVGLISINARNAPQSRVIPSGPRAGTSQPTAPSSRGSSRIALRGPTLLPTLSVGKSVSQAYASYRSRSSPALQSLLTQRNQLLSRASEAFRKMDGAGARKYSSEANALNVRIRQEEDGDGTDTAREMLRDRHRELSLKLREAAGSDGGGWGSSANASTSEPGTRGLRGQLCTPTGGLGVCLGVARRDGLPAQHASSSVEERTEWFLDCHGLHVHEALEIVEEFLLTLESSYPSHRGLTYLGVGVGGGGGSGNGDDATMQKRSPKLASAVKGFLASWGYPYSEADGVIAVDHLTHAM